MYLVIGASGNVGREVTRLLIEAGEQVRVLTRDPGRTAFPDAVEVVRGDLDDTASLESAMKGADRAYSLMRPDPAVSRNLATAAASQGLDRIVLLTSLAAEAADTPLGLAHREAELAVEAAGIAWAFLRPTNFASNSLAWAPSIRAAGIVRAPFGRFRSAVIDPRDIAAVAVAELRSPDAVQANRVHRLTGPRVLGLTEQIAIIGEVLGREISYVEQSEAEARDEMVARGLPAPVAESILAGQRGALTQEQHVYDTVGQVTGRPATPYRDWVTANRAAFA
jgi:uncharacterized protein YbjT (DUF2867 family)